MKLKLPDAIANQPGLLPGLMLYWVSFRHLDTCRINGYGIGAIPHMAIAEYCRLHEITGVQRERMFRFIHAMDSEWLKVAQSKQKT